MTRLGVRSPTARVGMALSLTIAALTRGLQAQCPANVGGEVEDLFQSDAVYPQERGEVQLAIAPSYETDGGMRSTAFVLQAQGGLTNVLQLEAEWDGPVRSGQAGSGYTWDVGNLTVGPRIIFKCPRSSPYHVALGLKVELPIGSENGDRRFGIEAGAIFARDVPAIRAHVFTGLSIAAPLGRGDGGVGASGATDAGTSVVWDSGLFVRAGVFRATGEFTVSRDAAVQTDLYVTPGVIWHSPPWEIGLGVPIPLTRGASRGAQMHFVYAFGGDGDER